MIKGDSFRIYEHGQNFACVLCTCTLFSPLPPVILDLPLLILVSQLQWIGMLIHLQRYQYSNTTMHITTVHIYAHVHELMCQGLLSDYVAIFFYACTIPIFLSICRMFSDYTLWKYPCYIAYPFSPWSTVAVKHAYFTLLGGIYLTWSMHLTVSVTLHSKVCVFAVNGDW